MNCCCEVVTGGPVTPTWPQTCPIHGHIHRLPPAENWTLRGWGPDESTIILSCPVCFGGPEFEETTPLREILAAIAAHECRGPS